MVFLTAVSLGRNRGADRFWRRAMYLRLAWHFYGRKRNCFSIAIRYVHRALRYSTLGRKLKKEAARLLWRTRIKAACSEHGINYGQFMTTLAKSEIALNKKILSELAIYEPRTFQSLVEFAKQRNKEMGFTLEGVEAPPYGIITRGML